MLSDLMSQHVYGFEGLKPIKGEDVFIWQGDITTLKIDPIFNYSK